ncbi:MAG: hypothetical protein U1F52_21735 [Burkholderiales bacterium]
MGSIDASDEHEQKVIRTHVVVGPDRRIVVQLPRDARDESVEVIVFLQSDLSHSGRGTLKDFIEQQRTAVRPTASSSEVERWIADDRNAWD